MFTSYELTLITDVTTCSLFRFAVVSPSKALAPEKVTYDPTVTPCALSVTVITPEPAPPDVLRGLVPSVTVRLIGVMSDNAPESSK